MTRASRSSKTVALAVGLAAILVAVALFLLGSRRGEDASPQASAGGESSPLPPTLLGRDSRPATGPAAGHDATPLETPAAEFGRVTGTLVVRPGWGEDRRIRVVVTEAGGGRSVSTLVSPGPFAFDYPWTSSGSAFAVRAPGHREFETALPRPAWNVGTLNLVAAISYRGLVRGGTASAEPGGISMEMVDDVGSRVGGPASVDDTGRFEIDTTCRSIPMNVTPDGVYADYALLATRVRDGATASVAARRAGFFSTHEMTLDFRPDLTLEVRGLDGSPVVGARVTIRATHLWNAPDGGPAVRQAVTDSRGRCVLPWPLRSFHVLIRVFEPGGPPAWAVLRREDAPRGEIATVQLEGAEGSLRLTVRNAPKDGLGPGASLQLGVMLSDGGNGLGEAFTLAERFAEGSSEWRAQFATTSTFSPRTLLNSVFWTARYSAIDGTPSIATGKVAVSRASPGWEGTLLLPSRGENREVLWLLVPAARGGDWGRIESIHLIAAAREPGRAPAAMKGTLAWHVAREGAAAGSWLVPVEGIDRPSTLGLTAVDHRDRWFVVHTHGGATRRVACTIDSWEAAYDFRTPLVLESPAEAAYAEVHVVASDSKPSAFAQVAVVPADGIAGEGAWQHEEFVTDAAGSARVTLADPRRLYALLVRSADGAEMASRDMPPGASWGPTEVRLVRASAFRARLVLDDGRDPLSPGGMLLSRPYSLWSVPLVWDATTRELFTKGPVDARMFDLYVTAESMLGQDRHTVRRYELRGPAADVDGRLITLPRRLGSGTR